MENEPGDGEIRPPCKSSGNWILAGAVCSGLPRPARLPDRPLSRSAKLRLLTDRGRRTVDGGLSARERHLGGLRLSSPPGEIPEILFWTYLAFRGGPGCHPGSSP